MNTPEPFYRGKVRDLYPVDEDRMIIVASDRLSAFDVVFEKPLAEKGILLNSISLLWFRALRKSGLYEKLDFGDHLLESDYRAFPPPYNAMPELDGRSMLVKRCRRIDFECVVRGYLAGSGWKEYQRTGRICGHPLPTGLRQSDRLPEPLFTPSTKAPLGEHDENISFDRMQEDLGSDLAERIRQISLAVYKFAADKLEKNGIILCDTKFEFGLDNGRILLIDEALTPDSSRYWEARLYRPGSSPPAYDKQIIRDYLEGTSWNKQPPPPDLPADITGRAVERYREIEAIIKKIID